MLYALIMAGGTGTRLWPFSRQSRPKQTLKLVGERTMMQYAVDRLVPCFSPERILIVARGEYVPLLSSQVPELPLENFIVEPESRGTAAAIGLAAIHLRHREPNAIMAVLTADHFITDVERFNQALVTASHVAELGYLVTLGIKPTAPSTGYGYIKQGQALDTENDFSVFRVVHFIEKPDPETARKMIASDEYTWNSGMFIWRVDRILGEFERQMPVLSGQLTEITAALGTQDFDTVLNRVWPLINKQTIDYGVMEHAERVAVIPVDIGWSDVGSWSSLTDVLPANGDGNTVIGKHIGVDTRGSLVISRDEKRLVATIGMNNVVIVAMDDVVLVCTKKREQDVRGMVKLLEHEGYEAWL